jgi:hypothetical protein
MFYFFLNSLTRFIIKIDSKYYGSKKTKVKHIIPISRTPNKFYYLNLYFCFSATTMYETIRQKM